MDRSGVMSESTHGTRFHRSMSMGQGWPLPGKMNVQPSVAEYASKVVMRRRNNSTCDGTYKTKSP